jgi:hypothetical protein
MLLTRVASPLAPDQPSMLAFNAAASSGVPIVAADPSLANRDAAFALLAQELLQRPGEPFLDLLVGGALALPLDSPVPVADRAGTPASPFGGQEVLDSWTPLTAGSSQATRSEHSARGLLDSTWADDASPGAAAAIDSLFVGLADGRATVP